MTDNFEKKQTILIVISFIERRNAESYKISWEYLQFGRKGYNPNFAHPTGGLNRKLQ